MGFIIVYSSIFNFFSVFQNSQNCRNGQLYQPLTCLYGRLSVTPLPFYYLFDPSTTVSVQRSHGQPCLDLNDQ